MNYKADAECMWDILLPLSKNITLTFTDFDLEGKDILQSKCLDNLMVYDISSLIVNSELLQTHGRFKTANSLLGLNIFTDCCLSM